MKAVLMTTPGEPEVLQLQDVPEPEIHNDTEILVRLHAAGINPIDTKLRHRGTFYPDQMPAILGCDGAGVVEAVGSAVQGFQVGDEVYFCAGGLGKAGTGNYAEWAVVEERLVAHKPKSVSFTEAAAAPLVLITAWEALYDRGRLAAGQRVLIHAGAGGVGHVAIQLAKIKGAEVCTTVGSQEKARLVRQLGADYPILYKQTDFVQEALDWTGGEGVDLAFDTVGGKTFFDSCGAVRVYGDLVTLLEPDSSQGNLKIARSRNLRISLELMLTPLLQDIVAAQQHQGEILQQCANFMDEGKLKIHLSQTLPLKDAATAHTAIESGSTTGKIVLEI
ncbi:MULTISPECIES: zinc-dependent alcohol dehydrogenase family protein [unclassified Coleofasciculus]|uniref:zinc-dependent alcohol dehydrogenase family protein n=1 Tax=unclassified Coleofasciculus TaxID=2692782 RepID=UPI001880C4EB|nr:MULTISPECIES: zinc-dependent alcohol dehydrogenase family protein [unclassified Coleofasciculus]MBE9128040.1 zinc-dependent alcohol dehydrogenase family protein [Coleofasciculus sp. LEGE 07081]MBE9151137.1 zinc-dependent alcohol dehydrogenase family protein [Coleofasciculus sp. LEGE 07092]